MSIGPRLLLSAAKQKVSGSGGRSSLSDDDSYPSFCELAAQDPIRFQTFRSSQEYGRILEHLTKRQGKEYLRHIQRADPFTTCRIRRVCDGDVVGSPARYNFPAVGAASPTTLRYLKVYSDLRRLFGPLSCMSVVEVGVGYGGLARVLDLIDPPAALSLVDLPQVLALAQRFLGACKCEVDIHFVEPDSQEVIKPDLFVSNYAYSELRMESQEDYFAKYVAHAQRGYVTFNSITPKAYRSISAEAFAERVHGVVLKEIPLTFPGNRVVVWG